MARKRRTEEAVLHYGSMVQEIDGKLTFAGVMQRYIDSVAKRWNDETRWKYYAEYEKVIFPLLPDKPLEEYSEADFIQLLDAIRGEALRREKPLTDARLAHYRHLCRVVTKVAASEGVCEDVLWGSLFAETDTENAEKRSTVKAKLRKSMTPSEERAVFAYTFSDCQREGERIGLAIMLTLGLRNNEVCALSFEHLSERCADVPFPVLNVVSSTKLGSNEVKTGGKTVNAPRTLPVPEKLYKLLNDRRRFLEGLQAEGKIRTSIEELPIACHGERYEERCSASDLTKAGKRLFREIRLDEKVVAEISFELDHRLAEEDYAEQEATSYFFRRNFATHLAILGFKEDEMRYLMGHELLSPGSAKEFMTNPEILYRMKQKLEMRPVLSVAPTGKRENVRLESGAIYSNITDTSMCLQTSAEQPQHIAVFLSAREAEKLTVTLRVEEGEGQVSTLPFRSARNRGQVSALSTYYKMYGKNGKATTDG